MKNPAILLILLLFSPFASANKIDRLKTTEDVEEFVKEIEPIFTKYKYSKYEILSTGILLSKLNCQVIFEKLEIKNWEKIDINNDGHTDLIYIISSNNTFYSYIILDTGFNKYKNVLLSRNVFEDCELFKPIKINTKNHLLSYVIKQKEVGLMEYKEVIEIDTLKYKFHNFIEIQNKPADYQVKSIEYSTGGCYGSCPVFTIKLNAEGEIFYNGKWHVDEKGS